MPVVRARLFAAVCAGVFVGTSTTFAQLTETYTWNTDGSGFWDEASKWNRAVNGGNVSNNQAPDLRDNYTVSAIINRSSANPLITYRSGSRAVDRLTARDRFAITGGTLGVRNQGADFDGGFRQSGGRLEVRGTGNIEIHPSSSSADVFWDSGVWGGTGTGRFGVVGGADLVISGTDGTAVNTLERRGLRIDDDSSATFTSNDSATGNAQGGRLLLSAGARIENFGEFYLEQAAGGPRATFTSPDGTGQFLNYGTLFSETSGALIYIGEGVRTVNYDAMEFTGGGASVFTGALENSSDGDFYGSINVGDSLEPNDRTELVIARGGYNDGEIFVNNGSTLSIVDTPFDSRDLGSISLDASFLSIARTRHVSIGDISGADSNIRLNGGAVLENRGSLSLDMTGTGAHVLLQSDDSTGVLDNFDLVILDGGNGQAIIASGARVINRPGADVLVQETVLIQGRFENVGSDGVNPAGSVLGLSDLTLSGGGYSDGTIDTFGTITFAGGAFTLGSQGVTNSFEGISFNGGDHQAHGLLKTNGIVAVHAGNVVFDGVSNSQGGSSTVASLVVDGGRLTLAKPSGGTSDSNGASANRLEVFQGGRVVLAAPEQIGSEIVVHGNGDGVTAQLELTNHHESIDRLVLDNGGVRSSSADGRFYLRPSGVLSAGNSFISTGLYLLGGTAGNEIRVDSGTLSIDSEINEDGGAGSITKTGAGRLVLRGRERYTGVLKVTDGIVEMTGSENHVLSDAEVTGAGSQLVLDKIFVGFFEYGSAVRNVSISNGATVLLRKPFQIEDNALVAVTRGTFDLGAVDEAIGNLHLSTGVVQGGSVGGLLIRSGAGGIRAIDGTSSISANVTFPEFKAIEVMSGASLILTGQLRDVSATASGGILKSGSGTLAIRGPNTLHGGLFVFGGVVEVGADAHLGDVTADTVLNGPSSTLKIVGNQVSGTRTLRVTGDGGLIDTTTFPTSFSSIYGAFSGTLKKLGSGELQAGGFNGPGLEIEQGKVSLLQLTSSSVNRIENLRLATDLVQLDISNNLLVLGAVGGCGNTQSVLDWVRRGYGDGTTLGYGISSSLANRQQRIGLGIASALAVTELGGQPVSGQALILRLTQVGDADLNGSVTFEDLLSLAQHYGQSGRWWTDGDFDYNGVVNFDDLLLLAQSYGAGAAADTSAFGTEFSTDWQLARGLVPEPVLLPVSTSAFLLLKRSRRQK